MFYRCFFLLLSISSVSAQIPVTLFITYDSNPQQTAWKIVDAYGTVFEPTDGSEQYGYSNQDYITEEILYSLECGSYSFIFFDKRGNENTQGQFDGFWELKLADGTILAQQEDYSDWSFFHSTSFYIEEANCNNIYNLEIDFNNQTICPNDQVNLISSFELNSELNFDYLGNIGNSYYYVSNFSLRWYMADAIAKALGGYLIAINSEEENNLFNDLTGDLWTGLIQKNYSSNQAANVDWEWSNGEQLEYTNWAPNEPNNYNVSNPEENLFSGNNTTFLGNNFTRERVTELYASNNDLVWNDHSFSKFNRFVIEIEPIITWNSGENADNISVIATSNQTLTANLSVGNITDIDSVEINVFEIELADTVQHVMCTEDFPFPLISIINPDNNFSGSWLGPSLLSGPPFVGLFNSYNLDGLYTYEYIDENGCDIPFPVNITTSDLSAGSDYILNICADDSEVTLFDYLGNNVEENGIWNPILSGGSQGILNPQVNSSGSYTYTVSDSNCNDSSVIDVNIININPQPINNINQ